jgi:TetR/AcrR family transcriptional regulator
VATKDTIDFQLPLRERSKGRAIVRDKEAALGSILSAAEAEFARYGLQGARVEAIAKNAGVTKGLIFHYFESKEHLFEVVLYQASEPMRAAMAELEGSDETPPVLLRMIVERFLRTIAERPLAHLMFTLESIQNNGEHFAKLKMPSLSETIEWVLAKGVEQGYFCALDTKHAAINIVGLCMYYFVAARIHPDPELKGNPFDEEKLARHASEVMRFVESSTAAVRR